MDIKDILVPLHPHRDDRAACGFAARLAAVHGARVLGLCLTPLPELEVEDCYAMGAAAAHEVMSRMEREKEAVRAKAEAAFHAAMAACDSDWDVTDPGELTAETALRARVQDLVVLTRPATPDGHDLRLAECLIRLGGTPCVMVPPEWDPRAPVDHVAVAWNGSRQAKRAMDDALPLLKAADRVSVVLLGHADSLPAAHQGLIDHLRRKGVNADIEFVPKGRDTVGVALLRWCGGHCVDLLVMGAFGHTPQTERWLGGTTWTALTSAHLPVLMSC